METDRQLWIDNELIAAFMGAEIKISSDSILPIAKFTDAPAGNKKYSSFEINFLEYHSSWDWLMPVVEKIESSGNIWSEIGHSTIGTKTRREIIKWCAFYTENHHDLVRSDCSTEITRCEGSTKLEAVYKAVVEFIKWYNQQNTK
jgi:hypothetical protein